MTNNFLIKNNGVCVCEKTIKKHNFELYNEIIRFNENLNTITWTHKVYNYINNITEIPKCPVCGKNVKFHRFAIGYSRCCSNECHSISKETQEKRKSTNIKIWGVENVFQLKETQKKIKQTNLKKYGVENIQQLKETQEKTKQSNLKKYGVENYSQTKEFNEKFKNTCLNKYGVDSPIKNSEIKGKIKNSINNNYKIKWSKILKLQLDDIVIIDNNVLIKNFCEKHNEFEISKYNLINRLLRSNDIKYICTKCYKVSNLSSIIESEVFDFIINELNMKNVINGDRTTLNGIEIDIYLPNHKIGIEFDGLYWHSDIYKDKNYHLNKTIECEKQNIQLLHIFEDEWLYKKEIVESIIKSKLNINENKIFGRKCEISEIDSKTCNNFLNNNHIQGSINCKIRIGLFYDDELVSLMTFGKKRISMGNKISAEGEYEMLRFCNKINTQVIGGASKLLNYFIKTYNPKSILTFADRRYSNGNLYKQMGFDFINNTAPNYFYFKSSEMIRHYRFKFRKDILVKEGFDPNKTEREIMAERGYLRIYDCGHMKFEKVLSFNN